MQIKAVVTRNQGEFSVEQVTLQHEPKAEEVLVRITAVGMCHTDLSVKGGMIPSPLPIVLGHEGAGVVQQVGAAVQGIEPGDHVVLSYSSCGKCDACLQGRPAGCVHISLLNFGGIMPDGTKRIEQNGQEISTFFGQSSFSEYAVSHYRNVIKVPKDIPLEILAPLGCGISTGSGAVLNKLQPEPGSSIAVFGCGAVGLSAIMAAKVKGCTTIIAIDINHGRLELAKELGATHTINGKDVDNVVQKITEISTGGVKYAVETSGVPQVLRQAVESTKSLGTTAVVGAPPLGTKVEFDHLGLVSEKTITGVLMGSSVQQIFIPQLIELYKQGLFPYDKLIKIYDLEEINQAAEDSESGHTIKPVLRVSG
ncbi:MULTISPECIES: NAD(P)-dependent alcohol dehydrogenase [Paenibacillus]|uniref:Alcohol dehydrogenase n=1 Tax=Paenibacillus naphthalenovorans TaxID=162209 RepID=A0A0U2VWE7_9BACL|nr:MULTISPECIES: NAD(P)-dependent alcohol dehydrogenase [Paenibacillus]ALS20596.1 alcohol dehydrogenase [Paenibacillus naphthalenovorans]GCL73155.1 NAD(P)-dependent alcohol dehydrogenase [Paenibacillus naphthalenovorans]